MKQMGVLLIQRYKFIVSCVVYEDDDFLLNVSANETARVTATTGLVSWQEMEKENDLREQRNLLMQYKLVIQWFKGCHQSNVDYYRRYITSEEILSGRSGCLRLLNSAVATSVSEAGEASAASQAGAASVESAANVVMATSHKVHSPGKCWLG